MIAILVALMLATALAGDLPAGRAMRRLCEGRARLIGRVSRGQWLVFGAMLAFAVTLVWLLERDGVSLLAMFSPEMLGALASFEITAWVDALVAVMGTAALLRGRAALGWARMWLGTRIRPRRPRTRRVRRIRPPSNDDEPGFALAA